MSKFQEADDRVRRADVATNSPTNPGTDVATNSRRSQEERKTAGPTPSATSFSEWLLLLGMTGCFCVCVGGGLGVCVCVRERERERERVSVWVCALCVYTNVRV